MIKFQVTDCVMQLRFLILVILCAAKILHVFGKCRPPTYSISGYHLSGHVMSTTIVSNLSECVTTCVTMLRCKSLNFRLRNKLCELNDAGRHAHPEDYGPKAGFIYMDESCFWSIILWVGMNQKQDSSTWMCLNHPRFFFSIYSQC